MASVFRTLLAAVGLAPASNVDRLTAELQKAETRIAQLERHLDQARTDAQTWKRRHEDTAEAVAGWKQGAHRAEAETERARDDASRIKGELERAKADLEREQPRTEEWKRRAEAMKAELQEMRSRLEHAHQATESANEQLMAMEVKLDLIEAAIQVLDARTREQAVSSAP